jgi:hypothetical protein
MGFYREQINVLGVNLFEHGYDYYHLEDDDEEEFLKADDKMRAIASQCKECETDVGDMVCLSDNIDGEYLILGIRVSSKYKKKEDDVNKVLVELNKHFPEAGFKKEDVQIIYIDHYG